MQTNIITGMNDYKELYREEVMVKNKRCIYRTVAPKNRYMNDEEKKHITSLLKSYKENKA